MTGRHRALGAWACLGSLALGCGPATSGDEADATSGETSGTTNSSADTTDGTSLGGDVTTLADDGTSEVGDTTTVASETDTDADACAPADSPCPVASCLESWSYECSACPALESDSAACFAASEACAYPLVECALPKSTCGRVWGQGSNTIESFESEDSATCLLAALRDSVPGRYEIIWGEMGDIGNVELELLVGNDGWLRMQWRLTCSCPDSGSIGRSGVLELQPASYFDECLAAPTTDTLIACVFGFTRFEPGGPPPDGYAPPFTTGTCTSLDVGCPP